MASSGMLHHVALVRTDVSEDHSASIIGVTRIGELGTTLAVTSNRRKQRANINARRRVILQLIIRHFYEILYEIKLVKARNQRYVFANTIIILLIPQRETYLTTDKPQLLKIYVALETFIWSEL
jgi:hypothetical protein